MILNFVGGPAVGKTTFATSIYAKLKQKGVSVGLVTEFATQCIMEKNTDIFNYQYFISANQLYRQETAEQHYKMVVTDSPILLFMVYDENMDKDLEKFYIERYRQKDNLLFYIERNNDIFSPEGRRNTLQEGILIDEKIISILNKYKIDYTKLKNTEQSQNDILDIVQRYLD